MWALDQVDGSLEDLDVVSENAFFCVHKDGAETCLLISLPRRLIELPRRCPW